MNLQRHFAPPSTSYPSRDGQFVLATDAAALAAERDELRGILQFVERMANHHGQKMKGGKPMIPPEDTLSLIQHHPGIEAITKSYSDGKIPETPNPWKELTTLRAQLEVVTRERDEAVLLREEALARIEIVSGYHKRTEREVEIERALNETRPEDRDSADNTIAELLELVDNGRTRVHMAEDENSTLRAEVERLRGEIKLALPIIERGIVFCESEISDREMRATLERFRSALTAAPVATERWSPIASAPTDGTWILALVEGTHAKSGKPFVPLVVRFLEERWENDDMPEECDYQPTLWRPLPPPPAQEGGEG